MILSTGASSVTFHILSEESRGLFSKAIIHSSYMLVSSVPKSGHHAIQRLSKKLGMTCAFSPSTSANHCPSKLIHLCIIIRVWNGQYTWMLEREVHWQLDPNPIWGQPGGQRSYPMARCLWWYQSGWGSYSTVGWPQFFSGEIYREKCQTLLLPLPTWLCFFLFRPFHD